MKKLRLPYSNRIDFMDIGKFIAIIFVVLIHVLQRTLGGFTGNDGWGSILFLMLGVPPFFFFSAYGIIKQYVDKGRKRYLTNFPIQRF